MLRKRWVCLTAGWGLVALGIVFIPLPGPGLVLILAGLTLLSRHCQWAAQLKEKMWAYARVRRGGKE